MTASKVLPLGPWPRGINNRADESSLKANELRAAVNVDLPIKGNPRTRDGYVKEVSGQSMHSWWTSGRFPYGLAVDNNTLKAYDTEWNATTIRTGLKPAQTVSYAEVAGTVYWSNGFDNGKLDSYLADQPFGLAPPIGTPNLAAFAGDALDAGAYQVACTFVTTTREESGSTLAALVNVPANGGITVSQIPQPTDTRVMLVRLYVSPPNGDVLYWYRDLPVGMTSCTIGNVVLQGKVLETQWFTPMPPGHIVRRYNGRLLVATDNVLRYGVAGHFGQTLLADNYIRFDHRISLVEPVGQADQGGFFVASGKRTYYLRGATPADSAQLIAHPFGAVPGTGLAVPGSYFDPELGLSGECAFWMDDAGRAVLGLVGGAVKVLNGSYVGPIADSGSSLLRDIDGIRSLIAVHRGATVNTASATDQLTATVHRNGVVV